MIAWRFRSVILGAAFLMLSGQGSVPAVASLAAGSQDATVSASVTCQHLFAPAYYWYDLNFFPQWDALASPDTEGMIIVAGVPISKGQADPAYSWVIEQARSRGIRVLAYVQTFFGQRDPGELSHEISSILDWYDVDGIFIDEVVPDSHQVDYYASIVAAARQRPNMLVVINPGGQASRQYVEMADMIVTFEGNYNQYLEYELPDWMKEYPAERFIHIVHRTRGADVDNAIALSKERNAGNIYVTDDRPPNAYHLLPTYWEDEVEAVKAGC